MQTLLPYALLKQCRNAAFAVIPGTPTKDSDIQIYIHGNGNRIHRMHGSLYKSCDAMNRAEVFATCRRVELFKLDGFRFRFHTSILIILRVINLSHILLESKNVCLLIYRKMRA